MAQKPGIFVRIDEKKIGLVIKGCTKLLETLNCGDEYINGLKYDGNYGGFRVYFSEVRIVTDFLKQNFLPLSEKEATIHPLTTKLVLHDIFPPSDNEFKELVKSHFEYLQLKPVLDVSFISVSPQFPSYKTGDWIVEVDIPEIETLDVIKNVSSMDSIHLSLKSNEPSQKVKVSFYCTICSTIEHSRLLCPNFTDIMELSTGSLTEPNSPSFTFDNHNSTPKSKSAKQSRIDAIASNLGKKKSQMSGRTFKIEDREIKEEPLEETCSAFTFQKSNKRKIKGEDNEDGVKKQKLSSPSLVNSYQPDSDAETEYHSPRISTTDKNNSKKDYYSSGINYSLKSLDDDNYIPYNSPSEDYDAPSSNSNFPTSSQAETSYGRYRSEDSQASRDVSDQSDCSESFKPPVRATRKKPIYAPVTLPDRIAQIVLSRDLKEGELGTQQLEAFFNHVKKKMSPAKIAKQFTEEPNVLRQQLIWIKQQYYMTPKAGSGEDSRFMKWLEGMLDRFDSTPAKRKK